MGSWLSGSLIFLAIIMIAIIVRRIMKAIMRVGQLKAKEFKAGQSSFQDWESVFAHPSNIRVETWHVGDVFGTISGLINLKNNETIVNRNGKLVAPLLAHLISHEKFGVFLIDTGFDHSFSEKPWGNFEGMAKKHLKFFLQWGKGIKERPVFGHESTEFKIKYK